MPRLLRNAARCLRCGDVVESRHRHDYVMCSCGSIAVDGGPSYARLAGRGIADATYEPLHVFADGRTAAGNQFVPFLDGKLWWGGGDGQAIYRLMSALVTGTIPAPDELTAVGKRRLGYLTEVVVTMSPEPATEKKLLALVVDLRERLRSEPVGGDEIDQLWLPSRIAGPDLKATEWGLGTGLSGWFRRALNTRIE